MKKIALFLVLFVSVCSFLFTPFDSAGFSIQDEIELGKKFKKFVSVHFRFVNDVYINEYVRKVLKRITSKIYDLPFPIKLYVIKDSSINAFAAPAGYIFINTGLIIHMDNEDELAAILAHELAHVRQRHLAKNIERSKYLTAASLVGILAGILIGNPALSQAISLSSIAGAQTAALRYSRENERDADKLGLNFLIRAGYSPYGMVNAFEKIKQSMKLSGVVTPPPYMLTHPGLEERIRYIKDMISFLSKSRSFNKPKKHDIEYLKIKTLTEARYGDSPYSVLQDLKFQEKIKEFNFCVLQLGKLIIYSKIGQFDKAKAILKSQCFDPSDPIWDREAGIFFFLTKDFSKAEFYLKRAVDHKPDDVIAIFYLARVLKYKKDYDLAISYLKRVLLQDQMEIRQAYFILSQIFGEKGDLFNAYVHLAYFYAYSRDKNKYLLYLRKAESIATSANQKFLLKKLKKVYKDLF